jgi:hypothetical protein
MRRRTRGVLAAVMIGLFTAFVASMTVLGPPYMQPGWAAESCPTTTAIKPDFDGDRALDLAFGIPGEDLGTEPDAGAVEVRYADRAPQILYPAEYHAGDRFGASVFTAFVNDDMCGDLIVGVPGQDVAGEADAGALHIYVGSSTGLRYWRTLVQGSDGVPGQPQAGARFGESMAIGGFGRRNVEPHTERLYVGTPGLDIGSITDAGGVVELTITSTGEDVGIDGVQLTQDSPGVPGQAENGDQWGAPITGREDSFAAAAVGESVGDESGAGAFIVRGRTGEGYELLTQDTAGLTGTAEAGDRFGAAIFQPSEGPLWIGVPGEDLGETSDAGMAVGVYDLVDGTGNHDLAVTQDASGLAGAAEAGDRFGSAITSFLPYYEDQDERRYPVQVGVPGEDLGTTRDAGMVNSFAVLFHSPESMEIDAGGERIDQVITAGQAEAGDQFGATLASFDFFYGDPEEAPWEYRALYVIGAPGEDSGAGSVVRVQYPDNELRSRIGKQQTGAREAGDGFGAAIVREEP